MEACSPYNDIISHSVPKIYTYDCASCVRVLHGYGCGKTCDILVCHICLDSIGMLSLAEMFRTIQGSDTMLLCGLDMGC